jgi:hypothetical protein
VGLLSKFACLFVCTFSLYQGRHEEDAIVCNVWHFEMTSTWSV